MAPPVEDCPGSSCTRRGIMGSHGSSCLGKCWQGGLILRKQALSCALSASQEPPLVSSAGAWFCCILHIISSYLQGYSQAEGSKEGTSCNRIC